MEPGATTIVTLESGKSDHDALSRRGVAIRLASALGGVFAGTYDSSAQYPGRLYFVPGDALTLEQAQSFGIRTSDDLFGGVVPRPFVATKVITHPLLHRDASAPPGWSHLLTEELRDVTLAGFAAFSRVEAHRATMQLLADGPVRIKRARGIGGRGQVVVRSTLEAEAALAAIDGREIVSDGLVVEENLDDVTTFSVGRLAVGRIVLSYWGTQSSTIDNRGRDVYGGSSLEVIRGDFDRLLEGDMPDDARLAAAHARCYDDAAGRAYPDFFASRRNYDVAVGLAGGGSRRSGVLEQSWRIGGASAAEVLALEAFCRNPGLERVCASTVERYGDGHSVPEEAFVYFRGEDAGGGPLVKYAALDGDAYPR